MVAMVDTHVILWLAGTPDKLSRRASAAINEARKGQGLCISDMSLLEIATLHRKNRIRLNASLGSFLTEVESRFSLLPMNSQICTQAMDFPASYPKDPADRIIGATALVQGMRLITADSALRRSNLLQTIW